LAWAGSKSINQLEILIMESSIALQEILARLLIAYPHQCVWMTVSVKRSSVQERVNRCKEIVQYAREQNPQLDAIFTTVDKLTDLLIGVCEKNINDFSAPAKIRVSHDFKGLFEFFHGK
jgi:hypothetical protein